MLIQHWFRGPVWDDMGKRHDGPVDGKHLPDQRKGLLGIVDCTVSSVKQGFTSRGVPLYMCYPLRKDYPPFVVAVKEKHTAFPIVRFNYEHWDSKWPRGSITAILGYVGDKSVERAAIYESVRIPHPECNLMTPNREDYDASSWDRVIHIDPSGCMDVDDICCWRTTNGSFEFMVGIADVAAYVEIDSLLDRCALAKASTLYEEGAVVDPMLPTELSSGVASLRADGFEKYVLGLIYRFKSGSVETEWKRCVLRVDAGYSYESVVGTQDSVIVRDAVSKIAGYDIGEDTHRWIEVLMIDYNRRAAEVLAAHSVGLLRAHTGVTNDTYTQLAKTTGIAELAFLGSEAGRYVDSTEGLAHAGLGLSCYTHASSPLRRYADLANQRWLHHLLFRGKTPVNDSRLAQMLNIRCSNLKWTERFVMYLSMLDEGITEVKGIVVRVDDRKCRVYCPTLRRTLKGVPLSEVMPGDSVLCRIFCNLKQANLESRYVVQVLTP